MYPMAIFQVGSYNVMKKSITLLKTFCANHFAKAVLTYLWESCGFDLISSSPSFMNTN